LANSDGRAGAAKAFTLKQALQKAAAAYDSHDWPLARSICETVLAKFPANFDALNLSGIIAAQTGCLTIALDRLERAAKAKPGDPSVLNNFGNVLNQLGRHAEALTHFNKAIGLRSDYAEAFNNRATALRGVGRHHEALASYERAIALRPDYPQALANRALALREIGRIDDAIAGYRQALESAPALVEAWINLGATLEEAGRVLESIDCLERAIAIDPQCSQAHVNLGNGLRTLNRLDEALRCYERTIDLLPNDATAYSNRGSVLVDKGRLIEALQAFDQAIALNPDNASTLAARGHALNGLGRLEEAIASYDDALEREPDLQWLAGMRQHVRMQACDWSDWPQVLQPIVEGLEQGRPVVPPFALLALVDSPALQLKAARVWSSVHTACSRPTPPSPIITGSERIRIGYFSEDFCNHPVSHLMAGVFEHHDRSRFECFAFSLGPDSADEMRARVRRGVDHFIDISAHSDSESMAMARRAGIEIAVDLSGYTGSPRTALFAGRVAPIQVGYLGYLGTMGADHVDYLIADDTLIEREQREHYSERIAWLPSYQANDSQRGVGDQQFSRGQLGLPQEGFVFCCFNNNYKITPPTFASWMRILARVEGSVLYLFAGNPIAESNLRAQASLHGVDPDRLVFAPRVSRADYLARFRVADLFLDTWPYNAGTTASDALWVGVPVLTFAGQSMAARVCASVLRAIGLPELIAGSRMEYEQTAVALATHSEQMAALRDKLEARRMTAPLFDTAGFTQGLESIYQSMAERSRRGLPPADLRVSTLQVSTERG
jgi:predicted O-linked N-acetylglucosamine transferase (SPINDLY family)